MISFSYRRLMRGRHCTGDIIACGRNFGSPMDWKQLAAFAAPAALWTAVLASRHKYNRMHVASAVEDKVQRIMREGTEHLQILMDFDRTMTTYDSESAYGVIEEARSEAIKNEARAMFEYYFPIETCHEKTIEEKIPFMKEWYERAHDLFLKDKFHRNDILHAVEIGHVTLRPGVKEILDFSGRTGVPVIVFSAGIGNVLEEVLKLKYGPLPPSVQIVSNWMKFDDAGNLIGWTEPLVHMFNKNESHMRLSPIYSDLLERKHVILVGDSLGDVTMADGLPHEMVLRFGLLNHKVDAFLPKYSAEFDVVLTNDAPLFPLVNLLEKVEKASSTKP